jgi:hypothetical protein
LIENIDKPKKIDFNPIDLSYESFGCKIVPIKDKNLKTMIEKYVKNTNNDNNLKI